MDLKVDLRQPVKETVGSLEPSHVWARGQAVDRDGSLAGPGTRHYSSWTECECPDDCPRDHENE